jgi:hypothetical protein
MSQQSYAKRQHDSKLYRQHTVHLGPNRAQRRSGQFGPKAGYPGLCNTPYHKDETGTLLPGVK